jgi:hypothetical protein
VRTLLILLLIGCASGPSARGPEVRPIDEDLLALLPSGADAVVDVDMEQMRTWPAARRFFGLLPADTRAQLAQMGVNPWSDLDGMVLSLAGLGGGEPTPTLLLRGDLDSDKMAAALGATFVEYRRAQIGEAGTRALVRLSPRMVAYGTPADVRRVVDLVRGEGQSVRAGDRDLVQAFARAPSAKSGRPAVIAALVPSDAMRDRLRNDELPGADYLWLTFVLAVGDGFDFEIIGKTKSANEAGGMAAGAKASLQKLRARPAVRLLGLGPYLEDVVIVDRDDEVRLVYRLNDNRVDRMLGDLEALAPRK